MTENSSSVQKIVDKYCSGLLSEMQNRNRGADVGISVALYYPNNSGVPRFYQYGVAGPGQRITRQTVYAIGSVTKVFTATLAAYLSVQNVIGDLRNTLAKDYLQNVFCDHAQPNGPYWDDPSGVTFFHFATQTSGMPKSSDGSYGNSLFNGHSPPCPQMNWWNGRQHDFSQDKGYWIYSNAGFVTLGFAVAGAAYQNNSKWGSTYRELLRNIIADSLSMPFTFVSDDVPPGADLATGYDGKSNPVPITCAADVKSTAQDMLALLTNLHQSMQLDAQGGHLTAVQDALVETSHVQIAKPLAPPLPGQELPFEMGLGWQIPTVASYQLLAKDGSVGEGGCSCWVGLTKFDVNLPNPVGIAVLTNQVAVQPAATARTILKNIIELG